MDATAGLSSSAKQISWKNHCWASQQWHPWDRNDQFQNTFQACFAQIGPAPFFVDPFSTCGMISKPLMVIGAGPVDAVHRPVGELARWLGGMSAGLLVLVAVVICWRRLVGALHYPLETPALLAAGTMLATAALAVRFACGRAIDERPGPLRLNRLVILAPLPAVLAVGAALSLPGSSPTGLLGFWAILVGEECWSLWRAAGGRLPGVGRAVSLGSGKNRVHRSGTSGPHMVPVASVPATLSDEDITQQLVRSRSADGSEILSGWVRVSLAAGQRTASVHVAFCPPFARTPILTVDQIAGPPGRVKTIQLLPYGTRFDLKLPQSNEKPSSVLLQFSAQSKPPAGSGKVAEEDEDLPG